jgi:hypothetical protein
MGTELVTTVEKELLLVANGERPTGADMDFDWLIL